MDRYYGLMEYWEHFFVYMMQVKLNKGKWNDVFIYHLILSHVIRVTTLCIEHLGQSCEFIQDKRLKIVHCYAITMAVAMFYVQFLLSGFFACFGLG